MKSRKKCFIMMIFVLLSVFIPLNKIIYYNHSIPVYFVEDIQHNTKYEGTKLIERCLNNMSYKGYYNAEDISSFSLFYGDMTEDGAPDLVMALNFNNVTLMPVYAKVKDTYVYKGELGPFNKIESVEFRYMENLAKNALFIREKANEALGSFQTNIYIKGFAFINDHLRNIISIPINIEAYWNERFSSADKENRWSKITQQTAINWINGDLPKISLEKEHTLYWAYGKSNEPINNTEDFKVKNRRTITEVYTWSDKWGCFILGEKTYIPNGEAVAVLEDLTNQPYSLITDLNISKSRILFENGNKELVENTDLR